MITVSFTESTSVYGLNRELIGRIESATGNPEYENIFYPVDGAEINVEELDQIANFIRGLA